MSSNVWISSDWHFFHKGLIRGESHWEDKSACRNFDTVEEHNEVLAENINKCAKENDIIYFLGDFVMGGRDNIYKAWKMINCKNIHFIGGNHENAIRKNSILKTDNGYVNAQNLFKSYNELLEKKIGDETFVMCHYPFRTFHKASRGSIMLHGHCHSTLPPYEVLVDKEIIKFESSEYRKFKYEGLAKTMDIGVDTHPEFRPYNLDEVRITMKDRINLIIDHHK